MSTDPHTNLLVRKHLKKMMDSMTQACETLSEEDYSQYLYAMLLYLQGHQRSTE